MFQGYKEIGEKLVALAKEVAVAQKAYGKAHKDEKPARSDFRMAGVMSAILKQAEQVKSITEEEKVLAKRKAEADKKAAADAKAAEAKAKEKAKAKAVEEANKAKASVKKAKVVEPAPEPVKSKKAKVVEPAPEPVKAAKKGKDILDTKVNAGKAAVPKESVKAVAANVGQSKPKAEAPVKAPAKPAMTMQERIAAANAAKAAKKPVKPLPASDEV